MQYTANYNLKKPDLTDNVKVSDLNENADVIDAALKAQADALATHLADTVYQAAGGTATAITLTISGTLVDGYPITFIASAGNSGSATTINSKSLYKPGGTTAPTLISGKAYTVWYDETGDCFFIKASAEGDAVAANVLAGKTFSNDNDTGLVGTAVITPVMPSAAISESLMLCGTYPGYQCWGKSYDARIYDNAGNLITRFYDGSIDYCGVGGDYYAVQSGQVDDPQPNVLIYNHAGTLLVTFTNAVYSMNHNIPMIYSSTYSKLVGGNASDRVNMVNTSGTVLAYAGVTYTPNKTTNFLKDGSQYSYYHDPATATIAKVDLSANSITTSAASVFEIIKDLLN